MLAVAAGATLIRAEPPATVPLQAEILHTTTVKALSPAGFAHGKVTLKKGKVFPVVERNVNVVVLETGSGRVRVSPAEVRLAPRGSSLTAQSEQPTATE
jgi:hypothetical protein